MNLRITLSVCLLASLLSCFGCSGGKATFSQNKIAAEASENAFTGGEDMPREIYQQISNIMEAVFGTPDDPKLLVAGNDVGFVDIDNLVLAAGPVSNARLSSDIEDAEISQGKGLYRQHCVHCHGISGDGKGPTAAFLNPYPRDFTKGVFKFNSTSGNVPSTHEDLHQILVNGINGTAMPSFALLDKGEIEALVDYVKYLSVRGQSERYLIEKATELDEDEAIEISAASIIGSPDDEGIAAIIESWKTAEVAVNPTEPEVPIVTENPSQWTDEKKEQLFASVDRGRALYYSAEALCSTCHGETQLGDGNLGLYDEWTKEYHDFQVQKDTDGTKAAEYMELGGLEPRTVLPRNLRLGQYRGGRRPLDIYWRIRNGIAGSGMPAAGKLTDAEVWDIVNFVLYLPYEQVSTPNVDLPTLDRARD